MRIMKKRIKAIVKNSSLIYSIYYYLGSAVLRMLGLFIKTDKNLILFVSYGGKKYDDSPRVVYEYLMEHPISTKHKYVWAFTDPEQYTGVSNKVKIDTLKYYIIALKAGYWITNSSASRGLNFRKATTKNIMFQHGMTAIKKNGTDMEVKRGIHRKHYIEKFDAIFIEGKFETEILTRAMSQDKNAFFVTGLPRNDSLVNVNTEKVLCIKQKLNIPMDKKVILYAPTYRDQNLDIKRNNYLPIPFDLQALRAELGQEYILIITAHYEVSQFSGTLPESRFVFNAFGYPVINDLLIIADILISDYSNIVFDYSILERPIFCFGYDYEEFLKQRGFYSDLETMFSKGVLRTQDELVNAIKTMNYCQECEFTKRNIKEKYLKAYGNAAEKAVKIIFNELS